MQRNRPETVITELQDGQPKTVFQFSITKTVGIHFCNKLSIHLDSNFPASQIPRAYFDKLQDRLASRPKGKTLVIYYT